MGIAMNTFWGLLDESRMSGPKKLFFPEWGRDLFDASWSASNWRNLKKDVWADITLPSGCRRSLKPRPRLPWNMELARARLRPPIRARPRRSRVCNHD